MCPLPVEYTPFYLCTIPKTLYSRSVSHTNPLSFSLPLSPSLPSHSLSYCVTQPLQCKGREDRRATNFGGTFLTQ